MWFRSHDAILQTLDRASKGLFLAKECYQPTLDAWRGVPLIFAQEHPDPEAFDKNPQAELRRIRGRLVGECMDAWIDRVGHPRLMGELGVSDPEVERGIGKGLISLSTGLRNKLPAGERLQEPARPHHILLFVEGGEDLPGDKGAFILNTSQRTKDEAIFRKLRIPRLDATGFSYDRTAPEFGRVLQPSTKAMDDPDLVKDVDGLSIEERLTRLRVPRLDIVGLK